MGQRNLFPVKVSGKSFPDFKGCSGKATRKCSLPGKGFLGREISAQEKFQRKVLL